MFHLNHGSNSIYEPIGLPYEKLFQLKHVFSTGTIGLWDLIRKLLTSQKRTYFGDIFFIKILPLLKYMFNILKDIIEYKVGAYIIFNNWRVCFIKF